MCCGPRTRSFRSAAACGSPDVARHDLMCMCACVTVQEAPELAQFLVPVTAETSTPSAFSTIFSTGNIGWLEPLLTDAVVYTFAHKHAFSDDMHSHTGKSQLRADALVCDFPGSLSIGGCFNRVLSLSAVAVGRPLVLEQLGKTSRNWTSITGKGPDGAGPSLISLPHQPVARPMGPVRCRSNQLESSGISWNLSEAC